MSESSKRMSGEGRDDVGATIADGARETLLHSKQCAELLTKKGGRGMGRKQTIADALRAVELAVSQRFAVTTFCGAPACHASMFSSVVCAISASASRVKNAWCDVTITFGNVSRRASTSSCSGRSE